DDGFGVAWNGFVGALEVAFDGFIEQFLDAFGGGLGGLDFLDDAVERFEGLAGDGEGTEGADELSDSQPAVVDRAGGEDDQAADDEDGQRFDEWAGEGFGGPGLEFFADDMVVDEIEAFEFVGLGAVDLDDAEAVDGFGGVAEES